MAENNPTGDSRLVPLDLPEAQVEILRGDLTAWIASLRSDLDAPERLDDPDRTRVEVAAYQRLLDGLDAGEIVVPDEEASRLFGQASEAHDQANDYDEVAATHDAMHAFLAVLGGDR